MKLKFKRVIAIILLFMCMGIIYYNSSKSGYDSNKISDGLLEKVEKAEVVKEEVKSNIKSSFNITLSKELVIRKAAHMFEFFCLSILVSIVLYFFGYSGRKTIIYVLFFSLLYGVIDEYHQLYIVGRTSSVRDILIDFSGSVVGIIIFNFANYVFIRIKKYKNIIRSSIIS